MSVFAASVDAGIGILSLASSLPEDAIVRSCPTENWLANYEQSGSPVILALSVASLSSIGPLPNDVLDLLMAAVLFAEAIVRLDNQGSECGADAACFDALGDMKRSLNRVTWSRALT
jgi:hypothetical protein